MMCGWILILCHPSSVYGASPKNSLQGWVWWGHRKVYDLVLALEELIAQSTASYSGMFSFLKWFGVKGKSECFLFILPKGIFKLGFWYQVCGGVSPQNLFFLCPSVSLDLPTFLSSQSPT